jgi:macrolide-specific efflux system membrane fusion protein
MNSAATSATDTQADELLSPPRKKGRRKRWLLLVVIVMAGAGTYYYQSSREPEAVNQPLLVTAALGDIENTISSAGSLKPSVFVDVGAQVSGQLQQLHVEVGDKVVAGQLLAEIDARTQVSRVEASRAALAGLESQISSRGATLDLARANAQRQQRLMAAQAASQQDYDTAITNLANAEANLAQLEQQIAQSRSTLASEETQLEFTRIYAPITGTVVSIEMNEGRTLNANQQAPTILRIADLSVMTVETDISEADIGNLSVGMEIYFTTLSGGSRRWFGNLRQILPTPVIENNVVLYTGLFDVDNTDASLLPEMTAQVFFITSAARDVLTVPVGALTFMDANGAAPPAGRPSGVAPAGARPAGARPGGGRPPRAGSGEGRETVPRMATLRVLGADGSEQVREVVIGTTSRVSAEVISGVQAGEQVIAGIIQTAAAAQAAQAPRPPGGFIPGGFR